MMMMMMHINYSDTRATVSSTSSMLRTEANPWRGAMSDEEKAEEKEEDVVEESKVGPTDPNRSPTNIHRLNLGGGRHGGEAHPAWWAVAA